MGDHRAIIWYQGRAYTVHVTLEASVPVEEAVKAFDEMSETKLTVLPHGEISCAGFAKYEDRKFFLMYFPPKRRQLLWKNKFTSEQKAFVVWWPHLYIGIFFRGGAIENGYAMVSRKKLESSSDKLARLAMPNLSKKYGHICEGREGKWDVRAKAEETATRYADYFMKSEYISDINDHFPYVPKPFWPAGWDFRKPVPESACEDLNQQILKIWEALSEKDPKAVEIMDWGENFTVAELVQNEWKGKPSLNGNQISLDDIGNIVGPANAAFGAGALGAAPVAPQLVANFQPQQ